MGSRGRLDKLREDPGRDLVRMRPIQQLTSDYRRLAASADGAGLDEVRWMLEELRVSTFAQALGTATPVSEQRVRRAMERLIR